MLNVDIVKKEGLAIYHTGPALGQGALPSLFYFALSGEESLLRDPYNQPIQFLKDTSIRCFSFSLPEHQAGGKHEEALSSLAKNFSAGIDPIALFLTQAAENISFLIEKGFVDAQKIACAGLSRGGLFAALLALMDKRLRWILGYAPLTHLAYLPEFQAPQLAPIAEKYALSHLAEGFKDKTIRFYIGNRDTRVSTDACYDFIRIATDTAFDKGVRSPSIELQLSPSIGHMGHGTSPEVFQRGVDWLIQEWR